MMTLNIILIIIVTTMYPLTALIISERLEHKFNKLYDKLYNTIDIEDIIDYQINNRECVKHIPQPDVKKIKRTSKGK